MPYGNIFLFLINAVTFRREIIFNRARVVILLLLYSVICILVTNRIGVISELFHTTAYVICLILYIVASIILMSVYVGGCYFWGCRVKPEIKGYRLFMIWGLVGVLLAWLGLDLTNIDLLKGWVEKLGSEEGLNQAASVAASTRNPTPEKMLKDKPPLKVYKDLTSKKRTEILSYVKGKAGVYCIMNNKTKDKFVWGSKNLEKCLGDIFKKASLKELAVTFKTRKEPNNIYTKLLAKDWKGYSLYILEFVDKTDQWEAKLTERIYYYSDKLKPVEGLVRFEWSEEEGRYIKISKVEDPERFYAGHPRAAIRVGHVAVITQPKVKVEHVAVKVYYTMSEALKQKLALKENWRKAGIYRWVNWSTGRSYIGCSENLWGRFKLYFNSKSLEKQNVNLVKAINRQSLEKFNLEILEYCKLDVLAERERYYIDLYQPEFNRLKPKKPEVEKDVTLKPTTVEHQPVIKENVPLPPIKDSIPEVSKAVETAPAKAVETAPADSLVSTDEKIVPDQPGLSLYGAANTTDLKLPVQKETAKEESQPLDYKNIEHIKLNGDDPLFFADSKDEGLSSNYDLDTNLATYPETLEDKEPPYIPDIEYDSEEEIAEDLITNSNCEEKLSTNSTSTCEQVGKLGESSEPTEPISQASTLAEKPAKTKTKKTWTLSSETKAKMKQSQSNREKHPRPGQSIMVHDLTKAESVTYSSFREAAAALKMSVGIISRRIKLGVKKPYKGRYTFSIYQGPV
jgi:hypothetical protein